MDKSNPFDTSFIPQQPVARINPVFKPRVEFNLAMIVALALLVAVVTAAGGMYYWRITIEKRISDKEVQLAQKADQIDMGALQELERVAARLTIGKRLLENHQAFSGFLDIIEKDILQSVVLSGLEYSRKDDVSTVEILALAPSYMTVYLQEQTLRANPLINKLKLSQMSIDQDAGGYVRFTLNAELSPAAVRFVELVKRREQATSTSASNSPLPNAVRSENDRVPPVNP